MAFQVAEFEVAMGIYKAGTDKAIHFNQVVASLRFCHKFKYHSLFIGNNNGIRFGPLFAGM
jgi:hypothetical protein